MRQKILDSLGSEGVVIVSLSITAIFLVAILVLAIKVYGETILPDVPQYVNECGEPVYARVTATAYTSRVQETDDTPTITATNNRVKKGFIGVSRSLERKFPLRTIVYYRTNDGVLHTFKVMDRMSARWADERIDVWHSKLSDAKDFGVQRGYLWGE